MRKKKRRRYVVKNRGRAVLRIGILLLALLLIAGAVYGVVRLVMRLGNKHMKPLPFTSDANYTFTGSGFLYFADDKLCYDDLTDRKKNTSYRINTQELKLAASPSVSALYHDTAVQILGAEDSLVFSGKVLRVTCGNGHVAVLREDSVGATAIVIYDDKGIQTDQMDFDAARLMDFGFSDAGGDLLWTLEADFSAATPVSTLTTYNLDTRRTTGVMAVQGQLVEDVIFTGSSAFLSTTTHLIRFGAAASAESYREPVYGWELADYSLTGSNPLMLYRQREVEAPSSYKLYSVAEGDSSAAAVAMAYPPQGMLGAFLCGNKLHMATPTHIYSYDAGGKLVSTTELDKEITAAVKLSDTHLLLTGGNALYLYAVN